MQDITKEIVRGLIEYLKVRDQLDLLPEIVNRLEKQLMRLAPENIALVITAHKLNSYEKKLIKTQLESLFERKLNLQIQVNPNIIGGIVIKVADKVIDLTLNKDLDELAKKLKD